MAKEIEYFIAQRTSRGQSRGGGGVMLPVATLSVALSIAVMVITIAIILGFKTEVHTKLTSLSGQIVMSTMGGSSPTNTRSIERTDDAELIASSAASQLGTELMRISPIATRGAIIRTSTAVEGVMLKGVDGSYDTSIFESGLVDGELTNFAAEDKNRNVMIAKGLASSVGVQVGDKIELLVTDDDGEMRRDLYRVGGIYSSGLGEAEKMLIITDIRNVQRLNGWSEGQISNYELWLSDLSLAPKVADQINTDIIYSDSEALGAVVAYDVQRLYPSIFDWLAAHDINAVVIIVIMMMVALFNIITAMLILVLERTQLIGILKALGMNDISIRKIFLYRALGITTRGLLYGNGIAILFCLVQHHFKLLKLDEVGYILSAVPIDLSAWWLLLLNCGVILLILLLVVIPTKMVGRIEPSKAIKFQ
ncbi:MAG: FtsX-like permease family protein [Rikenellaceae bacterium]